MRRVGPLLSLDLCSLFPYQVFLYNLGANYVAVSVLHKSAPLHIVIDLSAVLPTVETILFDLSRLSEA